MHARSEFEKEKEFDKFLSTLLDNLSLNNHETVQITPRYTYDLIVNSATQNPAECAKQIHNFIQQGQKHTAFQKNYAELKSTTGWFCKLKNWVKKIFGKIIN